MPSGATVKIVAFDFDGVILESTAIKSDAMAALFAEHDDKVAEIVAYHERHAGLSRYIKFDAIYHDILGAPLTSETRERLGRDFSSLVFEKVLRCPFVPGAREFLEAEHETRTLFVVSGTPDEELSAIVRERGLAPYFRGVFGSNRGKDEILGSILADHGWRPEEMVFVGDAMADYEAAKVTGVPFIGRVPDHGNNPFPEAAETIPDLTGLDRALETVRLSPRDNLGQPA